MSFLASLDPGDTVTRAVLVALAQTSIVILLAALMGRAVFRQRPEARHGLWLGALAWVLISPAVAVVGDRAGLALWVVALPFPGPGATAAVNEVIPDATVAEDRGPSNGFPQSDTSRIAANRTSGPVSAEAEPSEAAMAMSRVQPGKPEVSRAALPEVGRRDNALWGAATLLWAAGALAGLARIAVGWRRLAAFSRAARPLDPVRHGQTLERARDALGIATLPPVVTSATFRGPVAVGLLRPRVLLPEGLAEAISSDSLRDVLVHECAHVLRFDPWVGLVQRLAGALFWPHPLVLLKIAVAVAVAATGLAGSTVRLDRPARAD